MSDRVVQQIPERKKIYAKESPDEQRTANRIFKIGEIASFN